MNIKHEEHHNPYYLKFKHLQKLFWILAGFTIFQLFVWMYVVHSYPTKYETRVLREAAIIKVLCQKYSGFDSKLDVIDKTLIEIDKNIKSSYPFTREDFITIAIMESGFNQYIVGLAGEKGIFQILDPIEAMKEMKISGNPFDIELNTKMSFHMMHQKYNQHKDYFMSIIAYNGVYKNGNVLKKDYWNKFIKIREDVTERLNTQRHII